MNTVTTHHLVRNEDLNHHGSLYAGRIAEWLVETGYISATKFLQTNSVVCANIHDIQFRRPVRVGEIARLDASIVQTGQTSLTVYVSMTAETEQAAEGEIIFVYVDEKGRPKPHNRVLSDKMEMKTIEQRMER